MPPTSTNRVTLSNPQFLINSTADPKCQEAFSIIENENLPHPLGKLLASFIANALYTALATAHVLNHCPPGQRRKTDLHVLISDWTFIVESSKSAWSPMQQPGSDHFEPQNTAQIHQPQTAGPKLKLPEEMETDAASWGSQQVLGTPW